MSNVQANNIVDLSGGIPTVKGQRLIPTAWVNFNGTGTVSIRDSENVSSITDNGVGYYTMNFTESMGDLNFTMSGSTGRDATDISTGYVVRERWQDRSASSIGIINVFVGAASSGPYDFHMVSITIMGGQ